MTANQLLIEKFTDEFDKELQEKIEQWPYQIEFLEKSCILLDFSKENNLNRTSKALEKRINYYLRRDIKKNSKEFNMFSNSIKS